MNSRIQGFVDKIWIDSDLKAFVKKGLSGTILIEGIARVLLFVITILLTHLLPLEDYGRYSFYMASIIAIATIGTLGLDDYLIRGIRSGAKNISTFWLIVLPILASLLVAFFWFTKDDELISDMKNILVLSAVLLTLLYMLSSLLKGHKHILSAQLPDQIIRPVVFLGGLTICWFASREINLSIVIQVLGYSILAGGLIAIVLLMRKGLVDNLSNLKISSTWSWDMIFFAALTFFGVLRHKLDIIILGYFDLHSSTAIYNVASKLSDFILIGLILTNAIYMPLFAEEKDAPDNKKLSKILESSLFINLVIGSTFLLIFLVLGPWILQLFGMSYAEGYSALVVLSSASWIYALIGPYIIMLMMMGFERHVLIGLMLGISLQVILCFLLLEGDPVLGMAIAKGAAIIVIQIYMLFIAWSKLNLKPVFIQWIFKSAH